MTLTDHFTKIASEHGVRLTNRDVDFLNSLEQSQKTINYQAGFNEALQLTLMNK